MRFIEVEKYKVTCILEKSELFAYGITVDDILTRKQGTMEFLRLMRQKVMAVTEYDWPGCAFSSQIEVKKNGDLAITFSETISDFVYNLKQTMLIDEGAATTLRDVVRKIEHSDESTARAIIKSFEENVKKLM